MGFPAFSKVVVYFNSGGYQLARTQLDPLPSFLFKAKATYDIPFHLYVIFTRSNIDIDSRFSRLKIRLFRQVRYLMLRFYGMICSAAVYIVAVNANTHCTNSKFFLSL